MKVTATVGHIVFEPDYEMAIVNNTQETVPEPLPLNPEFSVQCCEENYAGYR